MCGRFTQQLPTEQICDLYSVRGTPQQAHRRARYNGAPGQGFAACRVDDDSTRAIALLRWGLVPSWARDAKIASRLINARSETVHSKPSFRAAFRSRRCLIPADGWFEWQKTGSGKQPYFVTPADGSPLSFAALWEPWDHDGMPLETFTIITTAASPELEDIHIDSRPSSSPAGSACGSTPWRLSRRCLRSCGSPAPAPSSFVPSAPG